MMEASQIEIAERWLKANPRKFRTKRLRKKFIKNALSYVKFAALIDLMGFVYPTELLKKALENDNPFLSMVQKQKEARGK